jgi:membrane complex biogenesis BtpA family protein
VTELGGAADIFGRAPALVGMVHVAALPGTPRHDRSMRDIVDDAVAEARVLVDAGFDAVLIENMHDVPYMRRDVGPEIVAAMTTIGAAVRAAVDVPLGVQILAGANRASLAVAHAIGASFIRAEGYVFASVADEGILEEADAGPLLRYRRAIGAEAVHILADVKKKHGSHAITADVDIAATAQAAAFFGADGVILTGTATGEPTAIEDVDAARAAVDLPVIVGSGVTPSTVARLLRRADAVIVGSWIKHGGTWSNAPDPERARELVRAARG